VTAPQKKAKAPWGTVEEFPFVGAELEPAVAEESIDLEDLFESVPTPTIPDASASPEPTQTPADAWPTSSTQVQHVSPTGQDQDPAPEEELAPVAAPTSRLDGMRAAAEAASTTQTTSTHEIAERTAFEQRLASQERFFVLVDRILGLINQDPELQAWANHIVLTRDRELDVSQRAEFEKKISVRMLDARIVLDSPADARAVLDLAYDELLGISILGDLWRDESVDEICIDAWNKIAVERRGRLERTGYRFRSPEHARSVARQMSQKVSDRGVSNVNSLITAQLPQARVQFVYGPLSSEGLAITIRKFRPLMGMAKLLEFGAVTQEMAEFLGACVRARATIIVSGGTGTGKTTAINALSEFIPDDERVITIEDAFELQLSNTHVVSLQAKQRASSDDTVVVSQADLLVASLRMRPDRIVVGEIREPAAAAVFFDAANTGHDGSMTTIHADSPGVALNNRLSALLMRSVGGFSERVARESVGQAVHLVVQISRLRGKRFVSDIAVVDTRYVDETGIRPRSVFSGEVSLSGEVTHRRVGSVGSDTQLAIKLRDAGEEVQRWLQA
jgi:pilus assembly protein CpaF